MWQDEIGMWWFQKITGNSKHRGRGKQSKEMVEVIEESIIPK